MRRQDTSVTQTQHRRIQRGLSWGLANSLALRMGNVILGIVLARLLVPEQFGVFAVALTVQSILATFSELGMTADLVRHGDIARRGPTVATVGLATSVVLALIMTGLADPLATALGSSAGADLIRVLSLTLVLTGVAAVPAAIIQREYRQAAQLAIDLSSFGISVVATLVLIHQGYGAMSLAWARVLAQLATVVMLFAFTRTKPRLGWNRGIAAQLWIFGVPLCSANFLSWLLLNLDYITVGRTLGATSLGLYVLAFNISSWPMSALAQAVRAVALPAFAGEGAAVEHQERRLLGAVGMLLGVAAPAGALLSTLALPIVLVLYGSRWTASASVLVSLAIFGALRTLLDLIATYLTARGATKGLLVVQVIWTVALLPCMVLGARIGGLTGVGWTHVLVTAFVALPCYLVCLRRQNIRPGKVLTASLAPLAVAVAVGFAATLAAGFAGPAWAKLLVGCLAGGLVWVAGLGRWMLGRVRSGSAQPVAVG